MKRRRNSLRFFLIPFLSVFLMFSGLTIPADAEETDPLNTELSETVPETGHETSGQEENTQGPQIEAGSEGSEKQKPEQENTVAEGNETSGQETSGPEKSSPETYGNEVPGNEVAVPEGTDPQPAEQPGEETIPENEGKETEEKESEREDTIPYFLKGAMRAGQPQEENGNKNLEETLEEKEGTAVRHTVLLYLCGTDLETSHDAATHNLSQILDANFSGTGEIRFIVMTGGTDQWHMESEKTVDAEGKEISKGISEEEIQIWECFGADAPDEAFRSKMMLVKDQTGFPKDGLMSDYKTLKAFIDYAYQHYPSEKYDLILWDHGGGPAGGFAADEHDTENRYRLFMKDLLIALKENELTKNGRKFEIIDFDACMMGAAEFLFALSPYMNYYIASPRNIPAFGQEYTCWLNALGENPDLGSMDLGKILVDGYISFYNEAHGEATLAVTDVNAAFQGGMIEALNSVEAVLKEEATVPRTAERLIEFYDEMNSASKSLMYSEDCYRDLGQLIGQLGIAMKEAIAGPDTPSEKINDRNLYTDAVKPIQKLLYNQNVFYNGATNNYTSGDIFVRDFEDQISYDKYFPSSLLIYFPVAAEMPDIATYLIRMNDAMAYMKGDSRYDAILPVLENHIHNVARYALIIGTGYTVSQMHDYGQMTEIHAQDVFSWWMSYPSTSNSIWDDAYKFFTQNAGASEQELNEWMEVLIQQHLKEIVQPNDIKATQITLPGGAVRYDITIENTSKRSVETMYTKRYAPLPVLEEYVKNNPKLQELVRKGQKFMISFGDLDVYLEVPKKGEGEAYLKEWIKWYNDSDSYWKIETDKRAWHGIKDGDEEDAYVHLAMPEKNENGKDILIPVMVRDEYDQSEGDPATLVFTPEGKIKSLRYEGNGDNYTDVPMDELWESVLVRTVNRVTISGAGEFNLPISEKEFLLTPENYEEISSGWFSYDKIPDLRDPDDPEHAVYNIDIKVALRNIYNYELDITDEVILHPDEYKTDITCAEVQPAEYNGQENRPVLMYKDEKLVEGTDYEIETEAKEMKNAGKYKVRFTGKGNFTGAFETEYEIQQVSMKSVSPEPLKEEIYSGSEITPKPVLKLYEPGNEEESQQKIKAEPRPVYTLIEGTDYTLTYTGNIEAGKASITVTGIGNFKDTLPLEFTIKPCPINSKAVEIEPMEDEEYSGEPIYAKPKLIFHEKELADNTDYTLAWSDNTEVGTAKVTITGKGNFSGKAETTFRITKYSINSDSVSVTGLDDQIYSGKANRLKPQVWYEDEELTEGKDYELSWKDNTEPGTAVITITGIGNFGGERTETFTIIPCPINHELVWVYGLNDQQYTGKEIRLKPEVYVGRTKMIEGRDYTLRYRSNVEPGTAVVTIIGTGKRITGSTMRSFRIVKAPEKEEKKEEKKENPYIPLPVYYSNNSNGSSGTGIPNTYDTTNMRFWTCVHLLSLAGMAISFLTLRRMKAE